MPESTMLLILNDCFAGRGWGWLNKEEGAAKTAPALLRGSSIFS